MRLRAKKHAVWRRMEKCRNRATAESVANTRKGDANVLLMSEKRNLDCVELLSTKGMDVIHSDKVGSRVTCNPPPAGTDNDILVLVRDMASFVAKAVEAGFEIGGSFLDANDFTSVTRGEVNLIITAKTEFYRRFIAATRLAKRWNLLDKRDRIRLFQAVLYGNIVGN